MRLPCVNSTVANRSVVRPSGQAARDALKGLLGKSVPGKKICALLRLHGKRPEVGE